VIVLVKISRFLDARSPAEINFGEMFQNIIIHYSGPNQSKMINN